MSADDEVGDSFEYDHEDLDYQDQIGEGSTATVFKAFMQGSIGRVQVAVKEIHAKGQIDMATLQAVQRELFVLSRVDHDNILRFIGMVSSRLPVCLILEYCAGGSLFELLHNCWHIELSWKQKLKMIADTASALDYLHNFDPPILHRDLKSLNLMLLDEVQDQNTEPIIKLSDFGFARVMEESSMTQCVGTKHWMAPEVLTSTEYTQKADVFSFAMVTYEVVCRHVPFETFDPTTVARVLSRGDRPFNMPGNDWPEQAPLGMKELVERCWAQDPNDRPHFSVIVQEVESIIEKNPPLLRFECNP